MRQERFTEQAQEALALSQELVRQYHHGQWDVEHILMALLRQEKGLVVDILTRKSDGKRPGTNTQYIVFLAIR